MERINDEAAFKTFVYIYIICHFSSRGCFSKGLRSKSCRVLTAHGFSMDSRGTSGMTHPPFCLKGRFSEVPDLVLPVSPNFRRSEVCATSPAL